MAEGGVVSPKGFECTICLETFKQPKLLPCYHTFCAACLESYIERSRKGKRFECPLCGKRAEVPETGVAGFRTNFYIETADTKVESIPCEGCNDNIPADHRCLDCEENYCSRCTESHMKMKPSRHHKLMELKTADLSVRRKIKARTFCKKHSNKEIEVVCKQCNQLLCILCMLTEHQGHRSREVTEEAMEAREKLKETVDKTCIDKVLRRQTKVINNLKKTETKLKSSLESEKTAIRDQSERLHKAVDKAQELMQKKLLKKYREAFKVSDELKKKSETFSLSLNSLVTTACQVIEQDTDVEIIKKCETLNKQLLSEIANEPDRARDARSPSVGHLFTRGDVDVCVLQDMVGRVEEKHMKSQIKQQRPPVLTPLKDTLVKVGSVIVGDGNRGYVSDIAPISKNRAWVKIWSEDKLEQIDSTGKSLLSVDVACARNGSIAADDKDNCIISCYGDGSIKRVTTTGKIETIVSGTDGEPLGMTYKRKSDGTEEVMFSCVGTLGGSSAVFVAPYHVGAKATKWSSGYQYIHRITLDRETKKVCVSDHSGKCVTVLDESGQVLSKHPTPNYLPFSVCFDIQGGIFITGGSFKSPIQRINPDGTHIETFTDIIGCAVAADVYSRIWIGQGGGAIDIYKMK